MEWIKCFDGGNLLVEELLGLPIKLQLHKADIQSKVKHNIMDWVFNWLNIVHVRVITSSVKVPVFQHTFSICMNTEFSVTTIFSIYIFNSDSSKSDVVS